MHNDQRTAYDGKFLPLGNLICGLNKINQYLLKAKKYQLNFVHFKSAIQVNHALIIKLRTGTAGGLEILFMEILYNKGLFRHEVFL